MAKVGGRLFWLWRMVRALPACAHAFRSDSHTLGLQSGVMRLVGVSIR